MGPEIMVYPVRDGMGAVLWRMAGQISEEIAGWNTLLRRREATVVHW